MAKITIPYHPRPLQLQLHEQLELRRFSVVVAHRRFGKTVAVINHLIKQALLCKREFPRYGYIAPFRNQAEQIAWMYLRRYTAPIPGVKVNESKLEITLPNGAAIRIYGADNPDALRGLYFDGVILDEYAQMRPEVWDEIVRPALADREGWAIFIGTPKGVNSFYKIYQEALKNPELWFSRLIDVEHSDALAESEIALIRNQQTPNKFRQEFLCDFAADVEDAIIPLEVISAAFGKVLHPSVYISAPKVLGVDVARFGDDRSVIVLRQGLAYLNKRSYASTDLHQFSETVMAQITEHRPDATFIDEVGLGAGVVDMCKARGFDVVGINGGARPADEALFVNKTAECWWRMRQWLESGAAIPADHELREELAARTYKYDPANRIRLEKKEDMKARGLKSPDNADALSLTFAQPVARKMDIALPNDGPKPYDPWAKLKMLDSRR